MKRARAINNYVTLKLHDPVEVKKGNIVLAEEAHKTPRWADVLTVGEGLPDLNGVIQKPDVEVGELAYVTAHGRADIQLKALGEPENVHVASVLDILAVMKDKETLALQPLGSYIEIEFVEPVEQESLIVFTDEKKLPDSLGRVISVGKGWKTADGYDIPFHVKEGDIVSFDPFRVMVVDYTTLGHDIQKHLVMHGDITAVIEEV
jgi:co-chaperonin GroES (HSP10)